MQYDVLKQHFLLLRNVKTDPEGTSTGAEVRVALLPSYCLIFQDIRLEPTPLKIVLHCVELNRTYFVSKNDSILFQVPWEKTFRINSN